MKEVNKKIHNENNNLRNRIKSVEKEINKQNISKQELNNNMKAMKIDIQQKENEIIEYRNKINKNNTKIVKLKKI